MSLVVTVLVSVLVSASVALGIEYREGAGSATATARTILGDITAGARRAPCRLRSRCQATFRRQPADNMCASCVGPFQRFARITPPAPRRAPLLRPIRTPASCLARH